MSIYCSVWQHMVRGLRLAVRDYIDGGLGVPGASAVVFNAPSQENKKIK